MDDLIARALLAELRDGRSVEFIATGQSMWPFIPSGSVVRVRPSSELCEGELAAFERNGNIVVHRVRRIDDGAVLFHGDRHDEELVARARVLGVAEVIRRRPLRLRSISPGAIVAAARSVARRLRSAVASALGR